MAGSGQTIPTTGPFSVMIGGSRPASHGKPVTYEVHVTGKDGAHWVRRRYTDFEVLRSSMDAQADSLPAMPPKSFVRQRISAQFQRSRMDGLAKVAASAVGLDSMAASPGVRRFLGLDAPLWSPCATEKDPEAEYWERRLSRRIEAAKRQSLVSASELSQPVEENTSWRTFGQWQARKTSFNTEVSEASTEAEAEAVAAASLADWTNYSDFTGFNSAASLAEAEAASQV